MWRKRDREERSASLAVRDGGPAPVRRAVEWYRSRCRQASDWALDRQLSRDKQLSRSHDQSLDHGLDL